MKYRTLPGTEISVSEVGFGVETLVSGLRDQSDRMAAERIVLYALDRGINFFDTSDIGWEGRGEELLGAALAGERERVVIATKFGYVAGGLPGPAGDLADAKRDFSAKYVRSALDRSLKRLATDYIDFYQIHHPRLPEAENDDLYAQLDKFKSQGKVLAWGAVLGPGRGWAREGKLLMPWRNPAALSLVYNLVDQEPGRELMEQAEETGTCFFARMPLGPFGDLPGPETEPGGEDRDWKQAAEKVQALRFLAEDTGRTPAQAALKFACVAEAVLSAVPDIWTEGQVNEFSLASEKPDLTSHELSRIRELYENRFDAVRQER